MKTHNKQRYTRCLYFLSFELLIKDSYLAFSQLWLPTVQEVLQADWQEVWHSPQPPFFIDSFKSLVDNVLICFIDMSSLCNKYWEALRSVCPRSVSLCMLSQ